jgi:hypothetical protein
MTLPTHYNPDFYEPDMATHLQMQLKMSDHPSRVMKWFIKETKIKRMAYGLTQEEQRGLCDVASEMYENTNDADMQFYCVFLIRITRWPGAIGFLESVGFDNAIDDTLKAEIMQTLEVLKHYKNM